MYIKWQHLSFAAYLANASSCVKFEIFYPISHIGYVGKNDGRKATNIPRSPEVRNRWLLQCFASVSYLPMRYDLLCCLCRQSWITIYTIIVKKIGISKATRMQFYGRASLFRYSCRVNVVICKTILSL